MTPEEKKKLRLAYLRAYSKSDKGKASKQKYNNSAKGKAAVKAYNDSDKGKAKRQAYFQTKKAKLKSKKYRDSDKGKETRKTRHIRNKEFYAKYAKELRRTHPHIKEYQREYHRQYIKEHLAENKLRFDLCKANLLSPIKMKKTEWKRPLQMILDQIGDQMLSMKHIIIGKYFIEFGIQNKFIIHNPVNIKLVPTEDLTKGQRNHVTDEMVSVAFQLELLYPNLLNGFTEFIRGKIK